MTQSNIPFSRNTYDVPRRDYVALNNGLDSPLPDLSPGIPLEFEPQELSEGIESVESNGLSPFESASQAPCSSLSQAPSSELSTTPSLTSLRCQIRKEKSQTSWTLDHFWITILETRWSQRDRPLKNDRLLACKRCSWSPHGFCSSSHDLQSRYAPPHSLSNWMRNRWLVLNFGNSLIRFFCPSQSQNEHGASIGSNGWSRRRSHSR